ncbi:hypothetical protein AEAC466_03290 [Asticcacaulis sp. AC466]|nr:hypothetical protein AEAC466_03290 [Asticcacaulis sp. AC466]
MIEKMLHDPFLLICGGLFVAVALFMWAQKANRKN